MASDGGPAEAGDAPQGKPRAKKEKKVRLLAELPARVPYVQRFRCVQVSIGREVELRMAPPEAPAADLERFLAEVEQLARLDHPAVPTLLDQGRTRGQTFALVPLRDHPTLAALLPRDEVPLALRCRMVRSLADGLRALHRRRFSVGAWRADLIAWDPERRGAYFLHHRAPEGAPPPAGLPEDAARDAPPSPRRDVLGWARLAYRLLTRGAEPWTPDGLVPIRDHVPGLAPHLAHLLEASLAADPGDRPESGLAVAALLEAEPVDFLDVGPDPMEASGTIPITQVGLELARLREEGRLDAELPPDPPRHPPELEESQEIVLPPPPPAAASAPGGSGTPAVVASLLCAVLAGIAWYEATGGAPLGGAGERGAAGRTAARLPPAAIPAALPSIRLRPDTNRPEVRALAPSTQARFLRDEQVRELVDAGEVGAARFDRTWKRLRQLTLNGRLPEIARDPAALLEMRRRFRREPAEGLLLLNHELARLRTLLGTSAS